LANRFFVGGNGSTWHVASGNTNWSTTSGGASNATEPGTGDVAILDGNSPSNTISTAFTIQGLDCTGGTGSFANTLTHNTAVTLTINTGAATSLRFSSGMTYTPASTSSLITFTNTTGTAQLTSAGKAFTAITVNGAGGTVQQQDNLNVNAVTNSILTVTAGVFDANGNATTACIFSSSNSNTRSILLGSSVTLGGNVTENTTVWNFTTVTGLTFTKNSAAMTILNASSNIIGGIGFAGGGLTYNGLTVNASTYGLTLVTTGSNTFSTFSIGAGWSLCVTQGTTTTVTTAFTLAGTQSKPMMISNTTPWFGQASISCPSGTATLKWGGLQGITATGGATFTASDTFDFGGNSGWSITPPADSALTPAAIATAVWQDTTSGDFTTTGSIGKSLFTSGNAPGAASGLALVGSAVNASQIAGSTVAATSLSDTINTTLYGTVTTGASTTSVPTSALTIKGVAVTGVVANQYAGRALIFDGATTTAGLRGAAATISANTASNTPTFTVGTLPATPASGDVFEIV